jgi:hypothetical protein
LATIALQSSPHAIGVGSQDTSQPSQPRCHDRVASQYQAVQPQGGTSGAASSGGADTEYGASGWGTSSIRLLFGTPDADGNGIPGIWTLRVDGTVRFYLGSRTVLSGSGTEIIGDGDGIGWKNRLTVG